MIKCLLSFQRPGFSVLVLVDEIILPAGAGGSARAASPWQDDAMELRAELGASSIAASGAGCDTRIPCERNARATPSLAGVAVALSGRL